MPYEFDVPPELERVWFEGLDHIINLQMTSKAWDAFNDVCEPYGLSSGSYRVYWVTDATGEMKRQITMLFPEEMALIAFRLAASE